MTGVQTCALPILAGVTHVVNFDVPPSPEDYVHRIGRAGRPDATGDAFTLMAPEEQRHLAGIERFVGRAVPRVLLPDFNYGLKPNQLQQPAIYDDEQARARRAAMAKMGFAVVRQMPTTAHGGFRPVNAQGKPLSKPALKTTTRIAARGIPASSRSKAKPVVVVRTRVAASTSSRLVVKVTPKPVVKIAAKPAVRSMPRPIARPMSKMTKKKPPTKK